MGIFGYAFIDLTDSQKEFRRESLDLHAAAAQVSIGVVLALIQIYFLSSWAGGKLGKDDEEGRPSSPYAKHEDVLKKGVWKFRVRDHWRRLCWWMGDEIVGGSGLGKKGEWVLGGLWMGWLLVLCVSGTGNDYMHLTKRFGIIGASQLPVHYLLAMKSPYSPLQLLTRMSHEQLNRVHQILGRIVQVLLSLHAAFYLNFFILNGLLGKRARDQDVIIGLTSISIFTLIGTTALGLLRKWNYRVFYTVHIIGATALLPLLYFHVSHIRPFILEAAGAYVMNLVLRTVSTMKFTGELSLIPGTNLVQITIPLSGPKKQWRPGQHVYLHQPSSANSNAPRQLRKNPFTIASLPQKDGQLQLIARKLGGNTKILASLAQSAEMASENSMTLMIEGPYGVASHLPNFSSFDRILLVAGGVGATFIVPVWRHILESRRNEGLLKDGDVRLVWAVGKLAETSWAFPHTGGRTNAWESGEEKEVYITGRKGAVGSGSSDTIELAETDTLVEADDERQLLDRGVVIKHKRPILRDIVDETFTGSVWRVAILVCGPIGMGLQLRHEVGRWVRRGKDVYYHAEIFGL